MRSSSENEDRKKSIIMTVEHMAEMQKTNGVGDIQRLRHKVGNRDREREREAEKQTARITDNQVERERESRGRMQKMLTGITTMMN